MKVKKMLALAAISLTGFGLVACGNTNSGNGQSASGKIEVISRENGSGDTWCFHRNHRYSQKRW